MQGQGEGQNPARARARVKARAQGGNEQGDGSEAGGSGAGTGSNPRSDAIYDPVFAASRQERLNPDDQFKPEEAIENPNPEDGLQNNAQVNYRQVHARYQEQAVQSMENNYIPIGLKDLVKDYFTSLSRPGGPVGLGGRGAG